MLPSGSSQLVGRQRHTQLILVQACRERRRRCWKRSREECSWGSQGRLHGRSDMSHRMNRVRRVWWVAALRPGCALPQKARGPQVRRRLPWALRCALGRVYLASSGTALAVLSSDTSGFHLRAHPESSPQPAHQVPRSSGVHEGMRMSPSSQFPCLEVSKLFWGLPTSPPGTSTTLLSVTDDRPAGPTWLRQRIVPGSWLSRPSLPPHSRLGVSAS